MTPTCLIRQDPPGEKFFVEESIISVSQNLLSVLPEDHDEEEVSSASESLPDLAPSSELFEGQPLPSESSTVPIVLARSVSKFDPSIVQQPLFDNDEPIDDSSRRNDEEIDLSEYATSSDGQIPTCDAPLLHPTIEPVSDPSAVLQFNTDDSISRKEQDRSQEEIAMDQDLSKVDLIAMSPSLVMQDSTLIVQANNNDSDQCPSDTNGEDIAMSALDIPSFPRVPVDPSVIQSPESLLDSLVVSPPEEDEPLENSCGSSETNSEEITWVAPVYDPSNNIMGSTNFEELEYFEPYDDRIIMNDEDLNLFEVSASSTLPLSTSVVSLVQTPRVLLDPSVTSHHVNRELVPDLMRMNAHDIPMNISDDDGFKLDPSSIHLPQNMGDASVVSQPKYDSQVFHQIIRNDNDDGSNGRPECMESPEFESRSSPSIISDSYGYSSNFPRSSDNSGMNSSGRSKTSDLSGSLRCSGSFRASDYFERTIIEEYNLRIEEEQRDCSLVSMPVVAAVYDDATTIIVRPTSTAGNNLANIGNTGARQTSQPLDGQKPPEPSPRTTTLALSQLRKLRQDFGLPTGVVLEMAEFQRIACTFFVCDTNEVEENCIKECAQLAAACQTQAIFCYGTYQREILYPPSKLPNGKVPPSGPALVHCAAEVRQSGRFMTTKQTTMKLMEIAKRIPLFDRWPSEKVAVTIFTDRTFHSDQEDDKEFVSVIRSLVKLGARVVIRLNTSQRDVVSYYLYLKQTFSSLTVIYSYDYQRRLVHHFNPWLNYGAPLHRARELGFSFHRTVEFLGKRILNKDHLREFLVVFYGKKTMVLAPDIHSEWSDFYAFLKKINQKETKHLFAFLSKRKNRPDSWINFEHLERLFKNENEEVKRKRMTKEQRGNSSQFLRVEI